MKEKPTVPDIVMMAGGAVCLLFSFFVLQASAADPHERLGKRAVPARDIRGALRCHRRRLGLVRMKFANVKLPEPILSFSWKQIRLALSIFAVLLMFGFLILDTGYDKAIGFWLMMLGAIALVVGSVMETIGLTRRPPRPEAAWHRAQHLPHRLHLRRARRLRLRRLRPSSERLVQSSGLKAERRPRPSDPRPRSGSARR